MFREYALSITMIVVTICAFVSYIPQIVKTIKTKSSDDLSTCTWILWTLSSSCETIYSILLERPELIFASASELLLIIITLILSLVYKSKPETQDSSKNTCKAPEKSL